MNCDQVSCKNPAAWYPILLLYSPADYKSPPAQWAIGLKVCDYHKEKTDLSHYLDDNGWKFIVESFKTRNLHEPERARTKLTFQKI